MWGWCLYTLCEFVDRKWTRVSELSVEHAGKRVLLRGRLHNSRVKGKRGFIVLRQRTDSVQGIISVDENNISKQMVNFVGSVTCESIVELEGTVQKVAEPIQACTQKLIEIQVEKFFSVSPSHAQLPILIEDASRSEAEIDASEGKFARVDLDTRLNNRVIELRVRTLVGLFLE